MEHLWQIIHHKVKDLPKTCGMDMRTRIQYEITGHDIEAP